jgi:hypothetical protein
MRHWRETVMYLTIELGCLQGDAALKSLDEVGIKAHDHDRDLYVTVEAI